MELKTVFEIEASTQINDMQIQPTDRFTLEFSTEFILTLNQYVLKLSSSINKIDNFLENALKNISIDSLIYTNDLKCFKVLFERIIHNILNLMECIGGEKFLNRRMTDFYTLIDEYCTTDLKLNFFDTLDLLVENALMLGDQIHENAVLKAINLDAFYNPSSILKKMLFEKFIYAKKQSEEKKKESKPNSPNSPPSSPIAKNVHLKEKFFFLEVMCLFFITAKFNP